MHHAKKIKEDDCGLGNYIINDTYMDRHAGKSLSVRVLGILLSNTNCMVGVCSYTMQLAT